MSIRHNYYISRCPEEGEQGASPPSISDVSEADGYGRFTSREHLAKETGVKFKMPKKQRKNTDLLMQKMFKAGTCKARPNGVAGRPKF